MSRVNLWSTAIQPAREDSLLIDVGANVGGYTAMMREAKPEAYILAFEPLQAMWEQLYQRFCADEKVVLTQNAVSDGVGYEQGYAVHEAWTLDKPERARRGRNAASLEREGPGTFPLHFVDLDTYLGEQPWHQYTIDLLKVDTDGYEYKVLDGAVRTIAKHRPLIYLELSYMVDDIEPGSVPAFLDLIYDTLGYTLLDQDGQWWSKAARLAEYPWHTSFDVLAVPNERRDSLTLIPE